jgi:serine O-acetyltransferase
MRAWEPLHLLLLRITPARAAILRDVERWTRLFREASEASASIPPTPSGRFSALIRIHPEFRSLFYYRVRKAGGSFARALCRICAALRPPMRDLYLLAPEIGPGLFIQHGFSTIVTAERIGRDCWINQQVTIGYTGAGRPVIGNNVTIHAGAKVIGKITVGDNVVIGANAVVLKDVPADCTVVGVPAYIVKRGGAKVREPLS